MFILQASLKQLDPVCLPEIQLIGTFSILLEQLIMTGERSPELSGNFITDFIAAGTD